MSRPRGKPSLSPMVRKTHDARSLATPTSQYDVPLSPFRRFPMSPRITNKAPALLFNNEDEEDKGEDDLATSQPAEKMGSTFEKFEFATPVVSLEELDRVAGQVEAQMKDLRVLYIKKQRQVQKVERSLKRSLAYRDDSKSKRRKEARMPSFSTLNESEANSVTQVSSTIFDDSLDESSKSNASQLLLLRPREPMVTRSRRGRPDLPEAPPASRRSFQNNSSDDQNEEDAMMENDAPHVREPGMGPTSLSTIPHLTSDNKEKEEADRSGQNTIIPSSLAEREECSFEPDLLPSSLKADKDSLTSPSRDVSSKDSSTQRASVSTCSPSQDPNFNVFGDIALIEISPDGGKIYCCKICTRRFTHAPAFSQHKRSHERHDDYASTIHQILANESQNKNHAHNGQDHATAKERKTRISSSKPKPHINDPVDIEDPIPPLSIEINASPKTKPSRRTNPSSNLVQMTPPAIIDARRKDEVSAPYVAGSLEKTDSSNEDAEEHPSASRPYMYESTPTILTSRTRGSLRRSASNSDGPSEMETEKRERRKPYCK